ncbi:MAG TPA: DUF2292 domain-containing protein [Planctomycetaceae bacterium]|nr:DUF2292 domain-containing protein [Planctomycetaceae bacterium]HRE99831.1 YezD family protein [Pirellulaceae bacterium]
MPLDDRTNDSARDERRTGPHEPAAIERVVEALRELRFGSVNILVQDGVIVQIDRTEKVRLRGGR